MNITIDRELLEQAIDALEQRYSDLLYDYAGPHHAKAFKESITALREVLAQPQPVHDDAAYKEAVSLATALFKKHFAHEEHYASGQVVWSPCDTAAGVISQIDNMVSGLVQPQPVQQCKWPTCQSEKYQQDLEDQIMRELVGEQPVQEPVAPVGTVTRYLGNDGYMKWAFQPEAAAWLVPRDQRAAERGAESCFSVYTSPQAAQPLKPDMFWNSDDADEPHDSIGCFLNDQICQHDLEVGAVFTIWRAKKFPSMTIRVTAIDEDECEAEYEVIEQAHGIKGTT